MLVAPVDYRNIEKPQGFNAYQRAEEEFQLKKAMALAEAQARKDAMDMKREEMSSLTPFQAASLAMQQERLDLQKQKGGMMVDPDTGEIIQTSPQKPMPVGALNLQDEITQSIAGTGNIAQDAFTMSNRIKAGQVPLQPSGKAEAFLRNKLGYSDEQSRNYASYNTFVEKLRNDTLRLNKGVQTEGDAQRALNELVSAGNDTQLAAEAMQKIADINNRALGLQKERLTNLRANYKLPELDLSSVTSVPLASGQKTSIPDGATATNPQTGQKIKRVNGQWVTAQ